MLLFLSLYSSLFTSSLFCLSLSLSVSFYFKKIKKNIIILNHKEIIVFRLASLLCQSIFYNCFQLLPSYLRPVKKFFFAKIFFKIKAKNLRWHLRHLFEALRTLMFLTRSVTQSSTSDHYSLVKNLYTIIKLNNVLRTLAFPLSLLFYTPFLRSTRWQHSVFSRSYFLKAPTNLIH